MDGSLSAAHLRDKLPRHGGPMDEYYRDFFCDAFTELKEALKFGQ